MRGARNREVLQVHEHHRARGDSILEEAGEWLRAALDASERVKECAMVQRRRSQPVPLNARPSNIAGRGEREIWEAGKEAEAADWLAE